jgi:hypothetical protein
MRLGFGTTGTCIFIILSVVPIFIIYLEKNLFPAAHLGCDSYIRCCPADKKQRGDGREPRFKTRLRRVACAGPFFNEILSENCKNIDTKIFFLMSDKMNAARVEGM